MVTVPKPNHPAPRRFRRRHIVAVAILLGLVAAAWKLSAQVDRLRPGIVGRASDWLGMEVAAESLGIRWLPWPTAVAKGVTVHADQFTVQATTVTALPALPALLRGRVHLTSVTAPEIQAQFQGPPEIIAAALRATYTRLATRESGDGGGVSLEHINAPRIVLQQNDQPIATVAVSGTPFGTDAPAVEATLSGVDANADARATFRASWSPGDFLRTLDASGDVSSMPVPAGVLPIPGDARVDASYTVVPDAEGRPFLTFEGALDAAKATVFSGTHAGRIWFRDGQLVLNDFTLDAPAARFRADAALRAPDDYVIQVFEGTVTRDGLDSLLRRGDASFSLAAGADAALHVRDVLIGRQAGAPLRLASGHATFEGLEARVGIGGEPLRVGPLSGGLRIAENVLTLESLTGGGAVLNGTLTPDLAARTLDVNVSGSVDLAHTPTALLPRSMSELRGRVLIDEARTTVGAGQNPLYALHARVRLEEISGVVDRPGDGGSLELSALNADFIAQGEGLELQQLTSRGVSLSGRFTPAADGTTFDLRVTIDLTSPYLAPFLPADLLKVHAGNASLEILTGTWRQNGGLPQDLRVAGTIKGLEVEGLSDAWPDHLRKATAQFATNDTGVSLQLNGTSDRLGPLAWNGTFATADHTLNGTLHINLAGATGLPGGAFANQALDSYPDADYDVALTLPTADRPGLETRFARKAVPPLQGTLSFSQTPNRWDLTAADVQGRLNLDGFQPTGPQGTTLAGEAAFTLFRAASPDFTLTLDATDARLGLPPYAVKRPGDPLNVTVTGGAETMPWTPERVQVTYGGETLQMTLRDGALHAPDINLDVAALNRLFPGDVRADGRLTGSFVSSPVQLSLALDAVDLTLAPGVAIQDATGRVRYRDGYFECDQLRIDGPDNAFTVNAGFQGGDYHATLKGDRMDLDALLGLVAAARALAPQQKASPEDTRTGRVTLEVSEARYKGQLVQDLRANVRLTPDATVADPIACRVGEGTLEGTARLLKGAEGGPDTAAVKATFNDVDAAVLDALLFDEPRGLGGRFTGNADLRFAVAEDLPPTHTLDGTIAFDAVDGTYGKARSATKLLSVLKTTEVLWGRLPTLRDEGLTYDTSQGRLTARNGVLDINTFSLASKSYALSAEGRVNFPEDRMNVEAQFRILESVRNVLGMVPVIGNAVGQLDDRGGLRIQFTGSPQDPQASIITPRERLREGVGNLLDRATERLGR